MKVFKGILRRSSSDCGQIISMVGDNEIDAIRDYFERKEEVTEVYSITKEVGEYYIDHSGREVRQYKDGSMQYVTTYNETVRNVAEVENLLKK